MAPPASSTHGALLSHPSQEKFSHAMVHPRVTTVIFDLGDGNLTEEEAYSAVAREMNISAGDVATAFKEARESLRSDPTMLDVIRELKAAGRTVFAMSNISAPDWDVLVTKADPSEWALFDQVFISAKAHERKPNVGFYQYVLKATGVDPTRTVFVDDKLENVLTARSFGLHGIVFDDANKVARQLRNLVGDPIQRAQSFLAINKKRLVSVTSRGDVLSENFAQLLILEATGNRSLVDYVEYPRLFNFFQGVGMLTTHKFPDDLDTTSIGLTVSTHIDLETKHNIMDEMLACRNQDGLVQVYFDDSRPRIDPVVCVNILTLFYRNGRGHELAATLDWVYHCLLHRAYTDGTLYYATAEAFLFFLSRLMESCEEVRVRFKPVFKERVTERFGIDGDALALSMRLLAGNSVGLVNRSDLGRLLAMQQDDGSWTSGWFYKYASSGMLIKNDGLTTSMAIRAIKISRDGYNS
ncbi:HAD-like domain-containing protein [Gautieria morchelliformis]|nr:HAD-like domain-containing protein [Gautieria morchelliformis]